jgi:hypothetical protein
MENPLIDKLSQPKKNLNMVYQDEFIPNIKQSMESLIKAFPKSKFSYIKNIDKISMENPLIDKLSQPKKNLNMVYQDEFIPNIKESMESLIKAFPKSKFSYIKNIDKISMENPLIDKLSQPKKNLNMVYQDEFIPNIKESMESLIKAFPKSKFSYIKNIDKISMENPLIDKLSQPKKNLNMVYQDEFIPNIKQSMESLIKAFPKSKFSYIKNIDKISMENPLIDKLSQPKKNLNMVYQDEFIPNIKESMESLIKAFPKSKFSYIKNIDKISMENPLIDKLSQPKKKLKDTINKQIYTFQPKIEFRSAEIERINHEKR